MIRGEPHLEDWWAEGKGTNSWTMFPTKNGLLHVYVRRSIGDREVLMIVNISRVKGFGSIRPLYRTFCEDIPAIAENVINRELDTMLERWGWDWAYRDLADIPTRVNKAFQNKFPGYKDAHSPLAAIMQNRKEEY